MANKAIEMTMEEFVNKYGKKVFEVVTRQAKGKYKDFAKIIIKESNKDSKEEVQNLAQSLLKNAEKLNNSAVDLNKIAEISGALLKFSSIVGIENLCSTVAGFYIIDKELKKMSDDIKGVAKTILDVNENETFYKFDNVLEDYKDMLDSRKIGKEYSEEKYRELISSENTVLKLMIKVFMNETCNNRGDVLYAIMALSSMMACTLVNFDEIYYYNNRDKQKWHMSHDSWMEVFDKLTTGKFVECLQDYAFIEEGNNQYQTDLLVTAITDEFKEAKQTVLDRQFLIETNDTRKQYSDMLSYINQGVIKDINSSIAELNLENDAEVQELVQTASKKLDLYS